MESTAELAAEIGGLSGQAERCIARVGAAALDGATSLIEVGIEPVVLARVLGDNPRVYREGVFDQGIMLEKCFRMIECSPSAQNVDAVVRPLGGGNEGHALEFLAVAEAGAAGVLVLVAPELRNDDYFSSGIQEDEVFLDQAGIDFITNTELVQVTSNWRKVKEKVKFWVGDRKGQDATQRTDLADLPFLNQVAWYFAHLKLMAKSVAGEHAAKQFKLILPRGASGGIPKDVVEVLTTSPPPGVRDALQGVGIVVDELQGRIK